MDWLLTVMGCTTFLLAGKKVWWAWYLGLATQVVWVVFALVTAQYGFLLGVPLYGAVYTWNAYKWTKEKFATEPAKEYKPEPRTFIFAPSYRKAINIAEDIGVNPYTRDTVIFTADTKSYEGYHFHEGDRILRGEQTEDQIQFIRRNLVMNKLKINENGYLEPVWQ